MKKPVYSFGTVSHGTMRNIDLLRSFGEQLDYLAKVNGCLPKYMSLINDSDRYANFLEDHEEGLYKPHHTTIRESIFSTVSEIINEELFNALNGFAAPYMYFGSHIGDGSDYGFWITEDIEQDFDGLKVSDTSEVPKDYTGEVLHVNDHGNITLYSAKNGNLLEIWARV